MYVCMLVKDDEYQATFEMFVLLCSVVNRVLSMGVCCRWSTLPHDTQGPHCGHPQRSHVHTKPPDGHKTHLGMCDAT